MFCEGNGATTIFENLLQAMSYERQTTNRRKLKENKVMELIYKMCYRLSQKCSYFQKASGIYLKMSHITSEGK